MFVIESAIAHAAESLNVSPAVIQQKNLLRDGDEFPYGQIAVSEAVSSWRQADETYDFAKIQKETDDFNRQNRFIKKGVAVMPICFGISYTSTRTGRSRFQRAPSRWDRG
jgi:xanthine dehydrogenase large subunit